MNKKTIFIIIACVVVAAIIIYAIAENIKDNTTVAITEGQQQVINTLGTGPVQTFVKNLQSKKNKMDGLPYA